MLEPWELKTQSAPATHNDPRELPVLEPSGEWHPRHKPAARAHAVRVGEQEHGEVEDEQGHINGEIDAELVWEQAWNVRYGR